MFRNLLLQWVVCSDQPFIEVENPKLRYLLRFLKSEVNVPSADTIKNDIIKIYKEEKIRLKEILQVY